MNSNRLAILVGESGVGKSTFANLLDCDGHWYESSRFMVDAVKKLGKEVSHDTVHEYATTRYTDNPFWQVPMILKALSKTNYLLYDGPRRIKEVEELIRRNENTMVVRISATNAKRFERLHKRDGITQKDFMRIQYNEQKETELCKILQLATMDIDNSGSLSDLREKAALLKKKLIS
jgi:dephospho-CoA kinase